MTREEQKEIDDLMRAQIAQIYHEIARDREATAREQERSRPEVAKLNAEVAKIVADTAKANSERFWVPFTVFAGIIVAIVTAVPRLIG